MIYDNQWFERVFNNLIKFNEVDHTTSIFISRYIKPFKLVFYVWNSGIKKSQNLFIEFLIFFKLTLYMLTNYKNFFHHMQFCIFFFLHRSIMVSLFRKH